MIETYSPLSARVKTYQVVADQAPEFAIAENPLLAEFLKQYYISQEYQGGPVDIAENIDRYIRIDNLTQEVIGGTVTLASSITATDDTITVSPSTKGYPKRWGLLKIGDEIITYSEATEDSFTGCVRGFTGISDLSNKQPKFEETTPGAHASGTKIENLSVLFLQKFYDKLKAMYAPGLEGVDLSPTLDINNFVKEARSLYESKGTDQSFKILFKALFGLEPKINDLEQFLIKPSFANYLRREEFSVELVSGDPTKIVGRTLFQDADPNNPLIQAASGPISEVTAIRDQFYKISVFVGYDENDLITGEFKIPGTTKNVGKIGLGASVVTVDSTIGFPQEGSFQVGRSTDTFFQELSYTSKTINQFIGVTTTSIDIPSASDVLSPNTVYSYEDDAATEKVVMRITGVLSNFKSNDSLYGLKNDSQIKVKQLGRYVTNPQVDKTYRQIFFNSWIYNTSTRFQIETLSGSTFTLAGAIDDSSLKVGDNIELLVRNTETVVGASSATNAPAASLTVATINTAQNSITVSGTFYTAGTLSYDIRRKQKKANSSAVPVTGGQDQITADITNTYLIDAEETVSKKEEAYVASNSLPSYPIATDKIRATLTNAGTNAFQGYNSLTNKFSILSFPSPVPFVTGDEVKYLPSPGTLPIPELTRSSYFVEVQANNNQIKLYPSRSFIATSDAVELTRPTILTGIHDFVRGDQGAKSIFPSRTLKRFILEQDLKSGKEQQTTSERTLDGQTGILINGVEIVNYKSDKVVYYGPLTRLDVVNKGFNYDVANPPSMTIEGDLVGARALANVIIEGSLKDVLVDPDDSDIKKISSIVISGGNGSGAAVEGDTELQFNELTFNAASQANGGNVAPGISQLVFTNSHSYKNGDRVVYDNNGGSNIGIATTGASSEDLTLVNGESYYIKTQTDKIFYLHRSKADAVAGINTVGITSAAAALNSGIHILRDYEPKRKLSRLVILDEGSGYSNRMVTVPISGVSTIRDYIEFENHGFSDGEVVHYGITSTGATISGLSTSKQYQILTLNKDQFRVCESGFTTERAPTTTNFDNGEYVRFDSTGTGYQTFSYPPVTVDINVITDSDTETTLTATPVVRGEIVDSMMYDRGQSYGSTIVNFENNPRVTLSKGSFGQIGLVISNGRIIDAFVQSKGSNYAGPPELVVTTTESNASGARLRAVVENGQIIDVKILSKGIGYKQATTGVNVVVPGDAATFETKVRPLVANKYVTSNTTNGDFLGTVEDGLAIQSVAYGATVRTAFGDDGSGHSPIIGWAYDGNPIYGPFGYDDPDDIQSSSRRMTSSYILDTSRVQNRPAIADFPAGFFVEDYRYDGSGDLDDHNGRFCKTPEFEDGIYAYFAAVDNILNPQFPYYIGDTYRSFALTENILAGERIRQNRFDFENSALIRNTFPYNMFGDGKTYDFVYEPYKRLPQISYPDTIGVGPVEKINVINAGTGYSMGSKIYFDESETDGFGAVAKIDLIKGQDPNFIDTEYERYDGVVFEWRNGLITGKIDPHHALRTDDFVQISGLSTSLPSLQGSQQISSPYFKTTLVSGAFVGVTTDIQVQFIPDSIGAGSSIGVGTETARILNVYRKDGTLRIRRSIGVSTNTSGVAVTYFSNDFTIPVETDYFESEASRKLYFNPTESVGFGTTVGGTIQRDYEYLANSKTRSLMVGTLYLEDHGIHTNDELAFSLPVGGANISCATSAIVAANFNLPSTVYAVRKSKDTIGLKTTKTSNEILFIGGGTDQYDYLLETQPDEQVTGRVERIVSTIQTQADHNLTDGDVINLVVKPGLSTGIGSTTVVTVKKIDDYLIINPKDVSTSGINTTANTITVTDHGFVTGDKVLYYGGSQIAGGLSQREYYVVRIDDNTISLTETFEETKGIPKVIGITSVGGNGQSLNPINPEIRVFKNNDIVFDLSDSTLADHNLKFYYDQNFFNDFVGTGTSESFEVIGVTTTATVGVASTVPADHPTVTLTHSNAASVLYYNLFSPSGLTTADLTVRNYSTIRYVDSKYNGRYSVVGLGSTEFSINLIEKPESLRYDEADWDLCEYTTKSTSATGGIANVLLQDGGYKYNVLPGISSIQGSGINGVIAAEGPEVNKLLRVTAPNDVFGYPSDNTLKPDAFIPRILQVKNFGTIVDAKVTNGGKFYINAPQLVLYDKNTGEIVDNGLFVCELSDSAVNSVSISVPPVGLTENDYGLAPLRNSNGISILSVESDVGFLTCKIVTPILGYTDEPIANGDKVFVEGIDFNNDGDGFNSGDYKFQSFTVADYNDATNPREVTFNLNGISTNPGTGATVALGYGQIVAAGNLAEFEVTKGNSNFIDNEPFKKNNNAEADIFLDFSDTNTAKIIVSGAEPINVGDLLVGKISGSEAEVVAITEFDGRFDISASIRTLVGWRDNIGFINDTNQVIPDNDYYQNLSYAIESTKTFKELITYVNDIVHPSGLKNFANTQIISEGNPGDTLIPAEDAGGLVLDFLSDPLRVDAIYNFDLGRDFSAVGNVSKFIELRNTRLADYVLNKNNRVLNIDDISPQFVSNESNDLSDFRIVATYPTGRFFQRFLTQSVYRDENPLKDHYQLNEFISVTLGQDTYFLQKFEMSNYNQVGLSTGYVQFDTQFDLATAKTQLIARPNEPFDTDYEIKSLQYTFSDSLGIGTTSVGNVELTSSVVRVAAASTLGVTTTVSVAGLDTSTTDAVYAQIVGIGSDQVDFLECAILHNGVDTYLTELASFNTRQNLSGLSNPRFIGTVTSGISSGVLNINFENGSQADVDIKLKIHAFKNNDVGVATNLYRYKIPFTPDGTERSGRLQVSTGATTGITTMVGITSFTDLSAKSTVWVSAGATQSLHQVYLLTDPAKQENFVGEFAVAAIGTTTGIGTFGADYKPDGTVAFQFYPDAAYSSGIVSVTSYNELLYKILDPNGTIEGIGDLEYGSVIENVSQNLYLGINNRDKKQFELKYKGTPIYARESNIANPSELDRGLGQFNFKHFFSRAEQLTYEPDSNLVGIAGSALVYYTGVGTAYLPDTVYAIKNNNNQFQIALNESDAKQGIAVTFVPGSGVGNKHRFTMRKRDSKSMIAVSGLVQKPISYTSINYTLDVPVAGFATAFVLSGISSIQSGDLLKIEDEYSIVRTVGFGTTTLGPIVGIGTWTLVEVERGAVGTAKTDHAAGEIARLFRGSFQILGTDIHFTQAPLGGDIGLVNAENLPFARATFSGRTFLRNDYTTNQLFDDISESFDGLETTYPLTSIGVAVTGIGSTGGNGVLFINNIFQAPFSENNTNSNFKIIETAGISSVQFTGISSFGFTTPIIDPGDINENQLPRGGIIVSLASTPGRGYAPFVGAKVRPEVDAFGAIQNIVGIPTAGTGLGIVTATYDNITGILSVRTSPAHGLTISDQVKLSGLAFTCPGYGQTFAVYDFQYDYSTGVSTVFTVGDHGLTPGDDVKLAYIGFSCTAPHAGVTTTIFPDGTQGYFYPVNSVGTTTSFVTNVGISTIAHTYDSGGQVQVGITTNIFPDYDESTDVTRIVSDTEFWTNVGPSTIAHTYVGQGSAFPWYDLTFGSGYGTNLGTISIGVTHSVGSGATITATVGAGGSLIFSVDHAGSLYTSDAIITSPEPNGKDLSIEGNFRLGIGSTTVSGIGCSVTVDILGISTNFVGLSSGPEFELFEVEKFTLSKPGYGFKIGDKFNLVGLSTDPDAGDLFIPFEIEVVDIFNDDIAAWQFGNIDYIDNIKPFQDGFRTRYPLYYQNQLVSFEIDNNDQDSREIDLGPVLLVFVNGVLQDPDVHYVFKGGTSIQFTTAPSTQDDVFIFFYRGTIGDDSFLFDINEVIKEGDTLELFKSPEVENNTYTKDTTNFDQQEKRIVQTITTASVVETPFYQGAGVNNDDYKPLRWEKQKADKVFGGLLVSKARDSLEPQINPVANIIGVVTTGDGTINVDSTALFRDIDGLLTDDFNLFAIAPVGFGTTAAKGVNFEQINDVPPLNTAVQGYIGFVTGITTSAGIGTDLGLVLQLDTNELVNDFNASYVQNLDVGQPIKLYTSGVEPAAGIITSIDTHDSDVVAISTHYINNVYYIHSISWDGSSRTGVITCNIHSGTDVSGLVGVGSTLHPAALITWGKFSSFARDASNPVSLNTKGLTFDPELTNYPLVQRRNVGLRNTGALEKTL